MAPARISPHAVLAGGPPAISRQAGENDSWHPLPPHPHCAQRRTHTPARSEQKAQDGKMRGVAGRREAEGGENCEVFCLAALITHAGATSFCR